MVDGWGNPLYVKLSPGTRNDIVYAQEILDNFDLSGKKVIADMGYDAEAFCEYIRRRGGEPIIPSRVTNKIQRELDSHEYKERHLVECLFQKLKNRRRLATRYEKLATTFRAVVLIAASLVWLQ